MKLIMCLVFWMALGGRALAAVDEEPVSDGGCLVPNQPPKRLKKKSSVQKSGILKKKSSLIL